MRACKHAYTRARVNPSMRVSVRAGAACRHVCVHAADGARARGRAGVRACMCSCLRVCGRPFMHAGTHTRVTPPSVHRSVTHSLSLPVGLFA